MKCVKVIGIVQIVLAFGFFLLVPRLDRQLTGMLHHLAEPAERFAGLVAEHRELYGEVEKSICSQEQALRHAAEKCLAAGKTLDKIGGAFQKLEGNRLIGKLAEVGKPFCQAGSDFTSIGLSANRVADTFHQYDTAVSPKVIAAMDDTADGLRKSAQTLAGASDDFHRNTLGVAALLAVLFLLNGVALFAVAHSLECRKGSAC